MTEYRHVHNMQARKRSAEDWWLEKSLPEKIAWGFLFGIGGLALFALFGWIVMLLWNWLMPDIFGLKQVTYWQAWGIMLLSSILFKGMGGNRGPSEKKRKRKLRGYIHEEEPADSVLVENQ